MLEALYVYYMYHDTVDDLNAGDSELPHASKSGCLVLYHLDLVDLSVGIAGLQITGVRA